MVLNMLKNRKWGRHQKDSLNFTELGFGSAPLGNLYRSILDEEANATLNRAWDLGVRYYDTAPLYGLGLSETRLNKFLRSKNENDYILFLAWILRKNDVNSIRKLFLFHQNQDIGQTKIEF